MSFKVGAISTMREFGVRSPRERVMVHWGQKSSKEVISRSLSVRFRE
ncbi:hypothetical protein V0288_18790 [Pannus brasiliensis CCIBt3594]|uniref:Uncharacterized protein n=1 Tax=Pannus brasiliensis CCIBt3594 TaxID=1427578 RepID=A0AAW9QV24_9CHRO